MFDGVKIVVRGMPLEVLTQNPLLSFSSKVDIETGEVLKRFLPFQHKGLTLTINEPYFTVRGSLPVFLNNGEASVRQMTMQGIRKAIECLQNELSINPDKAEIQAIEICVNIKLDYPVSEFLKAVKGHYNFMVTAFDKPEYQAREVNRSQYGLKLYDKGLHIGQPETNVLRVELKLFKSEMLQKYNISVLSDLENRHKTEPILKLLIDKFDELIIVDPVDFDKINSVDALKLSRWINNGHWVDELANRKLKSKKNREKESFEKMIEVYGLGKIKENLVADLCQMWQNSIEAKTDFLGGKSGISQKQSSRSERDTLPIKMNGQCVPKNIYNSLINRKSGQSEKNAKTGQKTDKIGQEKRRVCVVCGCDILGKKPMAIVCSKKCGNFKSGQARTIRERAKRESEEKILKAIIGENMQFKILDLIIKNCSGGFDRFQKMKVDKIAEFTKAERRPVSSVAGKIKRQKFELTKSRAQCLLIYLQSQGRIPGKETNSIKYRNIQIVDNQ